MSFYAVDNVFDFLKTISEKMSKTGQTFYCIPREFGN